MKMEEYKVGDDTFKTISSVIEGKTANSISTSYESGVTSITTKYTGGESVQEELYQYIQYLRDQEDFKLTKDMNLEVVPGLCLYGERIKRRRQNNHDNDRIYST